MNDEIERLQYIFAEIWSLGMTDCGPTDYHLFPAMLSIHDAAQRAKIEQLEGDVKAIIQDYSNAMKVIRKTLRKAMN